MKSVMIMLIFIIVISVATISLYIVKIAKNSVRENDVKLVIISSKIGYDCSVNGFELVECQNKLLNRINKGL